MNANATQILHEMSGGDLGQFDLLFETVYQDFRRIAQGYMNREHANDMGATDVVHEVYLRLIDQSQATWKDRSHFFAVGAHIMRHVLVDEARGRLSQKRGGNVRRVPMDVVNHQLKVSQNSDEDIIAVNEAIEKLSQISERRARIVELRFFGGLTVKETAEAVGISVSMAERQWRIARAWLRRDLSGG